MQQVADTAGVSLTAVSHILGARAGRGYAATTVTQVQAVAKRLGFRPNAAAKAVSSGRFSTVLLLQDATGERTLLSPHFILGLTGRLGVAGYRLTVAAIDDREVAAGGVTTVLDHIHADAVVANYHTELPAELRMTLSKARLPVVWVNRQDAPIAVLSDDEAMGRTATTLLLAKGHRRIAYLDPWLNVDRPRTHHSQQRRYHGYVQAMGTAGCAPQVWTSPPADGRGPDFMLGYRARLASAQRPTAVITAIPPWSLLEAAAGLGLVFPYDLQVISLSDAFPMSDRMVSHVCHDWRAIGEAAGELALGCLESPMRRRQRLIPPLVLDYSWPGEDAPRT